MEMRLQNGLHTHIGKVSIYRRGASSPSQRPPDRPSARELASANGMASECIILKIIINLTLGNYLNCL